jgi:hypothetical protein
MIHLNFDTTKSTNLLECIRHDAKKADKKLAYFESHAIANYIDYKPMVDFDYIIFANGHKAPTGHTENPPIVDIAKVLSSEGKQVYITLERDSHIAQEFLTKTGCKVFKWGDEL